MKKVLLAVAVLAAAVLGYGAWRAHTHAAVTLQVHDHGRATTNQRWADLTEAALTIKEASGGVLAEAALAPPHGGPVYSGPAGAVDCRAQEAAGGVAWQLCFESQSRWIASWVTRAATARVQVGRCSLDAPIKRRSDAGDWLLWWVPLPHAGGTPIAYHQLEMHVDMAQCKLVTAP